MTDSTDKYRIEVIVVAQGQETKTFAILGDTLLEHLQSQHLDISSSCGGNGTCGTCRIFTIDANHGLEPPTEIELEMAQDRGFAHNERLSCQSIIKGPCKIKIP